MRNLKKFLALVLAMLMVVSAAATVSAFDDVTEEHDFYVAIQDLVGKEIVQGVDENTFNPDGNVTRLQAAIMFARALTGETDPTNAYWNKGLSQFSDVTEFQYAVTVAVNAGIINGMGDGTYNPTGDIQFIQALKMAVCALGYGEGLTWGADGMEYYNVAVDLGLTAGLDYITEATKALTRGEFAQLIYNMIYADLADGTGSIAYNVFKVGYVEPVEPEPVVEMTTFIITATDEQTAYEGMDVAEGGYVGIQQLVNGVAAGDMIYVPVEVFGFEGDEDEAAFLAAYNLANYDAETGAFDYVEATGNSWKIYNTEVSVGTTDKKYNRFKYDSTNYYAVDELTDSAIRNEVVIYNTLDYALDEGNKQLFLNADGQVMDPDGDGAVLEAVYSVTGNIVSYRVLKNDTAPDGTKVNKGDYLGIAKATSLYGAVVDYIAESYTIVDVNNLTGAYELTVYDDDMDGKMDRAYYTPVYMAVQGGYNDGDDYTVAGPFWDEDKSDKGEITGMEDLATGDIFVYTYNEQLRHVTVLDVLEVAEGTVKTVNTTKKSESDGYSTIVLTDGTSLTLYNKETKASTAETKMGAEIGSHNKGAVDYTKATWVDQITSSYKFELVNDTKLLERLEAGSLIRYYARNNVVLFAETYSIDDVFTRVVLKDVIDADLEAVYLDVYMNGKVEEIAVTNINGKSLSELSWIKISSVLSDIAEDENKGNIYRIAELENGYKISEAMDETQKASYNTAFKLVRLNDLTKNANAINYDVKIEDGSAVAVTGQFDKTNRLRSDADTVWYFINGEKVRVFVGEPEDALIKYQTGTLIFANKIGWSGDNKGVADEIYVLNANLDETTGFGWGKKDTSVVYVSAAILNTHTWDYYEQGSADEFGLDVEDAESSYYKYSSTYVLDMETATGKTIYSTKALRAGTFYLVDEDGIVDHTQPVVIGEDVIKDTLAYGDIVLDDSSKWIDDVLHADYDVDDVYALDRAAKTSAIKKNDTIDDIMGSTGNKVVYYLPGYDTFGNNDVEDEDGKFAIIVNDISIYVEGYKDPATAVTSDATWTIADLQGSNLAAHHATSTITVTDGKVTGTMTAYNLLASDKLMSDTAVFKYDAAKNADYTVSIYKFDTDKKDYTCILPAKDLKVDAKFDDGVMTINGITYAKGNNIPVVLEEGYYLLYIGVSETTNTTYGKLLFGPVYFEVVD